MGATAIYWSLVALIPIYVIAITMALAIARYLFRDKDGEVRIWIPPAIFIAIKVGQQDRSDDGPS